MTSVLAVEGVVALLAHETWGMLLVAASAAVLVAFAIVEPATTRAAFDEDRLRRCDRFDGYDRSWNQWRSPSFRL
jgi:hypothetical protein